MQDGAEGDGRARLVVAEIGAARDRLLSDPAAWPDVDDIDAAGAQLIVSALKNGIELPERLRTSAEVLRLWSALALDDTGDADLSLAEGGVAMAEGRA